MIFLSRLLLAVVSALFVVGILQANHAPLALVAGIILGAWWTLVVLDLF